MTSFQVCFENALPNGLDDVYLRKAFNSEVFDDVLSTVDLEENDSDRMLFEATNLLNYTQSVTL